MKKIIYILPLIIIIVVLVLMNTNKNNSNKNVSKNYEQEKIEEEQSDTTIKNDLFSEYYEQAENLLQTMTLEEKVGQMFLARFPESNVIEEIRNYNPCGYILFGRDFKNETKSSILKKLENCQNESKIKLVLGVDEEGGSVVRVSSYSAFRSNKFLSPQQLWEKGQLTAILEDSTEKSNLLKSIGLNMNLAPVADVPTKSTSFIYNRSYGRGARNSYICVRINKNYE